MFVINYNKEVGMVHLRGLKEGVWLTKLVFESKNNAFWTNNNVGDLRDV